MMFSFLAPIYCPPPVHRTRRPYLACDQCCLIRSPAARLRPFATTARVIHQLPNSLYMPLPSPASRRIAAQSTFITATPLKQLKTISHKWAARWAISRRVRLVPTFLGLSTATLISSAPFSIAIFCNSNIAAFLDQIGFVPGMAAHIKSNLGPTAVDTGMEWRTHECRIYRRCGNSHRYPTASLASPVAYQFDWNPYVEVIGAQGTYFVIGYSESSDLAGVQRVIGLLPPTRVGTVPEKRFSVGVGEWVLENVRIALEYSHAVDYSEDEGGTGNSADAVLCQFTLEW